MIKNKLTKEITNEDAKKIIYNVFAYMLFTIPLIPEVIGFGVYSLKNTLFNILVIFTAILLFIFSYKDKVKLNIFEKIIGIYLVLVTVSCFLTKYGVVNTILGLNGRGEGLITIYSYVITFIIFLRGYDKMKNSLRYGIVIASILSIYGLLQALLPSGTNLYIVPDITGLYAKGTMKNPNMFSSYICIFLPMLSYCYISGKKNLSIISACLMCGALIVSKTLGGYLTCLGMLFVIIIYSVITSKEKRKSVLRCLILSLLFILIFIGLDFLKEGAYSNEAKATRVEIEKLKENDKTFGTGRLEIWKKGLKIIKNYPMFGVGLDNMAIEFETNLEKYIDNEDTDILYKYRVDKAHMEYLQVALSTGVPSLIVYLVFHAVIIFSLLKVVLNNKEKEENIVNTMILIAILSYIIQSLANFSVVQVAPCIWAILGMGANITLKKENVIS